ncbi:MAG: tetratricopeptide repeat protein [Verrucomicrobia bacterium]|nr:tetratricopeptide repeat protein [Verrucomicrobiota bacterium]
MSNARVWSNGAQMPKANTEQRKLAAIMFTDMVGYSALSQRNEKLAQELLEEHRALLRPLFPKFNGTEIKTIGDAFLVEFHSALEAAQCGIEIQRALAHRNHDVSPERLVELKIGIHIGDVVHRGGDVYGDGVNIASRIEPLAGAGGICVSMDVERQIRNALEARFEKLAPTELKNISVAMDLFRIVLPWEEAKAEGKWQKEQFNADTRRGVPPSGAGVLKLVAVAAVVLLAVGLGWWLVHQSGLKTKSIASSSTNASSSSTLPSAAPATDQKSIAVLPFVNMSADKADEYLSDGISEELITALSKITGLQVKARTSSFAFKGKNEDIQKIGEQLHVSHLLEGSVAKAGNKLRITAQLIKISDGNHLWSDTYDREMQDIFAVRSEVAQQVAATLKIRLLGEDRQRLDQKPTENLEAYNLYRQGRYYYEKFTEDGYKKAIGFFQQTIEKDPRFALAYAGVADNFVLAADLLIAPREAFSKAKDAALKAIELDDTLAEAHASLGMVHYHYDWDWAAAEKEFQRALALNPQSAQSHSLYSEYLVGMGRFDEAYDQGRRALEIDPLSPMANWYLGWAFLFAGRSDQAIQQLSKAVELDLNAGWVRSFLGRSYLIKGMQQRGIEELEIARRVAPNNPFALGYLGYGYAVADRRSDALKALQSLDVMEKQQYVSRMARVYIYAGLGDKDKAFEWLEKAYQERSDALAWFRLDPEAKNLRSDPRFATLMRKIGFTEP